jgi:hypothetical protein
LKTRNAASTWDFFCKGGIIDGLQRHLLVILLLLHCELSSLSPSSLTFLKKYVEDEEMEGRAG